MPEIGKFFLETTDNKLCHEVTIFDNLKVDVNTTTLRGHLKKYFKLIKMLLFRKIKTSKEDYQQSLTNEIMLTLDKYNEALELEGIKPTPIHKLLKELERMNKPKQVVKKTKKQKQKLTEKKKRDLEYKKIPSYIG